MITKIALFHPWIKSKGGAERVVLEILKKSKDKKYKIDVYTWVYDENNTFEEFKKFKINVIAPKFAEKISRFYLLRGLFLPLSLFSKIPLEKYDIFLISTSGMGELITFRNYKPGKTFAYVHTPLRAASEDELKWNLKYRYKNPFLKFLYLILVNVYRTLEKIAWKKIDMAIFNSELSLERARKHNLLENKKTFIIYPPVNTEKFKKLKVRGGDYFLYVSRFNPSKRQDILIESWKKFIKKNPKYKLILVGGVEDKNYFNYISKIAKETENIKIKTNLNDEEIKQLYANCLVGIFVPYMEDFGIVPFELLTMGKPLIAVNKGGYVKLIEKYSQFFKIREKEDKHDMINEINFTLEKFLKSKIKPKKINFTDLSEENFRRKLFKILDNKK